MSEGQTGHWRLTVSLLITAVDFGFAQSPASTRSASHSEKGSGSAAAAEAGGSKATTNLRPGGNDLFVGAFHVVRT